VPSDILNPAAYWQGSKEEFATEIRKLAEAFDENFTKYADRVSEVVKAAGPKL
jgi:ATP-dependent phosphoenolpyruvate carboxykinase